MPGASAEPTEGSGARARWPYWLVLMVGIVGVAATVTLTLVAATQYRNNEDRLLHLRVKEIGSVLTESLPAIQLPLASSAALAEATDGSPGKFMRFMTPYVGRGPTHPFVSASLWRLAPAGPRRVAVVGAPPAIADVPATAQSFLGRSALTTKLAVIWLRRTPTERLGYAFTTPAQSGRYVAYAEAPLPPRHRAPIQSNQAFSDLDYALYFGPTERTSDLLLTSVANLPITGTRALERVPFGDTYLTIVVTPRQPLGGTLPQRLPWIIAIVGALLTLGSLLVTTRLTQRRMRAEQLAGELEVAVTENQRLYAEQRTIAQTLQHALLPDELPQLWGLEASARYEPGGPGVDIGGDWYDVIPLEGRRMLVVVGDVSGHGLPAASTMASLRYAIHAYAAQDDPPEVILEKLAKLLNVVETGRLATVLCAIVDVDASEVTVASAGHLPPLLLNGHGSEYLAPPVGPPIGMTEDAAYRSATVAAPASATLLAFTDGLVERRGESLDRGLDRLREAASDGHMELPDLLRRLVHDVRHAPSEDDTAIVGLRWTR